MTLLRLATLTVLVLSALVCADPEDYWWLIPAWAANNNNGRCGAYGNQCNNTMPCCQALGCFGGKCLQAQCGYPGQECGWGIGDCCWHLGLSCSNQFYGIC